MAKPGCCGNCGGFYAERVAQHELECQRASAVSAFKDRQMDAAGIAMGMAPVLAVPIAIALLLVMDPGPELLALTILLALIGAAIVYSVKMQDEDG